MKACSLCIPSYIYYDAHRPNEPKCVIGINTEYICLKVFERSWCGSSTDPGLRWPSTADISICLSHKSRVDPLGLRICDDIARIDATEARVARHRKVIMLGDD
jgi:hypothetical protein